MIGERVIRLSGSHKQCVALARPIYYNRNVLIYDEATSQLNYETEKKNIDENRCLKGKKP